MLADHGCAPRGAQTRLGPPPILSGWSASITAGLTQRNGGFRRRAAETLAPGAFGF